MSLAKSKNAHIDYSADVKIIQNRLLRGVLFVASGICLVLAIVGVFLPVLPTTPLIILSAFLYTRCSPRFYNFLMNHPYLGPPLLHWRATGSIPLRAKILSITMLWLALGSSIYFFIPLFAVKVFFGRDRRWCDLLYSV